MQEVRVPKSRVRKKPVLHAAADEVGQAKGQPAVASADDGRLLRGGAGLDRAVLRHAGGHAGLRTLGAFNLVGGFTLIVAGVVLATNWR